MEVVFLSESTLAAHAESIRTEDLEEQLAHHKDKLVRRGLCFSFSFSSSWLPYALCS